MTSPRHPRRTFSQIEAERYRQQLRKTQTERHEARLQRIRRQGRWNQWGERVRGAALFVGLVVFFTWVYWMGSH